MLGTKTIQITPAILSKISEIDEFKGLWSGLAIYSAALQSFEEFAAHGGDVERVLSPLKEKNITVDIIRLLHAASGGRTAAMSDYKTAQNTLTITEDKVLETAAPEDVAALMDKLTSWTDKELKGRDMHPLLVIAMFAAIFLQISPFEDGNRRVLYMLIVLMMLKAGYAYAPFSPIGAALEAKPEDFYEALYQNQQSLEDGAPDWNLWLVFFLDALQGQKDVLLAPLEKKRGQDTKLPSLSLQILELFEHHERLQMNEIMHFTYARRATLKLRLNELIEGGYLSRHGKGRSTWYERV